MTGFPSEFVCGYSLCKVGRYLHVVQDHDRKQFNFAEDTKTILSQLISAHKNDLTFDQQIIDENPSIQDHENLKIVNSQNTNCSCNQNY